MTTITNLDELSFVPVGAALIDADATVWQRVDDTIWNRAGDTVSYAAADVIDLGAPLETLHLIVPRQWQHVVVTANREETRFPDAHFEIATTGDLNIIGDTDTMIAVYRSGWWDMVRMVEQ